MCSRKGSPVDSFASPLPSTLSRTRIRVSLVLRTISALRMSKRFLEGGEQYTVFVGRADRDPQAIAQSRMQVRSEEHTSELQSRLHLVCRLLLEKKRDRNIKLSREQQLMYE